MGRSTDVKTASVFLIGFLALSFGCKAGGAFHALGKGVVTAAKVASVVAVAANNSSSHGSAVERGEVVRETGVVVRSQCKYLCPVEVDGERAFVCASSEAFIDPTTNQVREAFVCD
jgi:hypothetical protein